MQEPGAEIARLLRIRRVAEMMMIEAQVGPRSRRSIFRDLKRLGYRTSFTHNGRYYTLEDIPRFDPQGLWFYEDVGFSRFGTLKQTVAELVPRAPEGRTHGELAALLRVRVHNTLLDLVESGALGRRIVEGAGEFVYLSPDPTEADRQIARRLELLHERTLRALPPDETVLAILAETVRASRVEVPPELVVRRLAARGLRVSREEVERIFEHHDLLGGKKTRRLPPHPLRHEESSPAARPLGTSRCSKSFTTSWSRPASLLEGVRVAPSPCACARRSCGGP